MAGRRLVIQGIGHGYHAGVRVDAEQAASIIGKRIGNRGGTIRIGGQTSDTHTGTHDGVFGHGVGGTIIVCDRTDGEFVHVGDVDGKSLTAGAGSDDVAKTVTEWLVAVS